MKSYHHMFSVGLWTGRQSKSGLDDGGPWWICSSREEGTIQTGSQPHVGDQQAWFALSTDDLQWKIFRNNAVGLQKIQGCGIIRSFPSVSESPPVGVFARSLRVGTIKRSNLKEWHELSKFRFNLEGDEGKRGCFYAWACFYRWK